MLITQQNLEDLLFVARFVQEIGYVINAYESFINTMELFI